MTERMKLSEMIKSPDMAGVLDGIHPHIRHSTHLIEGTMVNVSSTASELMRALGSLGSSYQATLFALLIAKLPQVGDTITLDDDVLSGQTGVVTRKPDMPDGIQLLVSR